MFLLTRSLVARNVMCEHSSYFHFPDVTPLKKNSLLFFALTRSRWKSTCSHVGFAMTDGPVAETS